MAIEKLTYGEDNWHEKINSNYDEIDSEIANAISGKVKSLAEDWGTSLPSFTVTANVFILLYNSGIYVVWLAGSSNVYIRNVGDNTTKNASNSATLDNLTVQRSGKTVTITSSSSATIMAFYC